MIIEQSQHIIDEISKVFIGKDEIIKKVLMTIYAGGHILLNDTPGTGKTTLALAFSKALGHILYDSYSESINTGIAPWYIIGLQLAEKVNVEQNTISFSFIFKLFRAKCIAAVPLDSAAEAFIPI